MARMILVLLIVASFRPLLWAAGDTMSVAAPAAEVKWQDLRSILGRLEAEYDRLQVINAEITQLNDAIRNLNAIQKYPPGFTRLTDGAVLREVNVGVRDQTERIALYRDRADALREPLVNAIGMLRELIYEDQQPEMLGLLISESKDRVSAIIGLKREINLSWKALEGLLDRFYGAAGLAAASQAEGGAFEAEFFQVLYYNLGLSSERFQSRLNVYKDTITARMDLTTMNAVLGSELASAREKYNRGDFVLLERELKSLLRRFDQRIPLDGVYYYLGQASQALGKNQNAVDYYALIGKASPYYIGAVAGMFQALFAQGKYPRVDFLYDKIKDDLAGKGSLNRIFYVVVQTYYEMKREKDLIDVSALADKDSSYYLGVLYVLGQSYARKEDFNTARSIFKTVSSYSKVREGDERFVLLARLDLAHLDFTEKKYDKALRQYLALLDESDLFAEALEGIGWCYLYLGNYYKAEVALKTLVNQAPAEPSGCEAMLLLARNYLKKAQVEWESEKERFINNEKIGKYLALMEQRFAEGEMDTAAYADLKRRLAAVMDTNRQAGTGPGEIGGFFGRSAETVNFLLKSYQTGEFIASPFKDQKEEILLRIRDLFLRSKSSTGGALKRDYFVQRDRRKEKHGQILETIVKARMFRVKALLAEHEWREEYGLLIMQELNRQERSLKADTSLSDSLRTAGLARVAGEKRACSGVMEKGADTYRKEAYAELMKLRESALNEEQEAFVFYYLGEMHYLIGQEVYLEKEDAFNRQSESYDSLRGLFEAGTRKEAPAPPKAPRLDYSEAERYFTLLLDKHPDSRYADAGLYSLLFCYTEENRKDSAVSRGEELLKRFPQSEYAPQTALILGEYYFDGNKLDAALDRYRTVLKFPESRWFDKALYKLGWTYYRLSDTKKAISAFFYLINEQNALSGQEMDLALFTKSLLTKESIDYIAISFAESDTAENDMTGLKNAKRFVRKIPGSGLSARILHKLGDVYREQLKYDHAIATYRDLKKLYPTYAQMPAVMYNVIECYELKGQAKDYQAATDGRRLLFKNYSHNSEWARTIKDSAAVVLGDSLAERSLLEAASYYYSMALSKESRDIYRQVIDMYWDYLKVFPKREKASECHYYIAEILFGAGDYLEAARQYMEVSKRYKGSKYVETAAMNAIVAAQNYLKQEEEKKKDQPQKR